MDITDSVEGRWNLTFVRHMKVEPVREALQEHTDFNPVTVEVDLLRGSGYPGLAGYYSDLANTYVLKAELFVEFKSTGPTHKEAEDLARRKMARYLYREQIELIHECREHIAAGSRRRALDALKRLIESCGCH